MQYYKEYTNNNINDSGKLIFIDNDLYVNNMKVINNRGIINDDVYILDNEVIGIKERIITNIVGILHLDSKIKYGNIKNKSLYLFKATNKEYPNFYVPYNNNKNCKIYCIIQFKEWKISDKLPIGNLIEVLGEVGNKETEFEHLRNYFNIKNSIWKINNDKKNSDIQILNSLQNSNEDYTVFSIDPLGSKDIDDAFHFKLIDNDTFEIGIHIASPIKFFENQLLNIMDRVSTIYTPIKNYNLLPSFYSDNLISLLENEKRFAISLIIQINNNIIISYQIKESIVKNIKNYNYEEFDKEFSKRLDKEHKTSGNYIKNMIDFIKYSKEFHKLEVIDSHKLVEYWMITANKIIANHLINKNISNVIIRVHKSSTIDINNNLKGELSKYIINRHEKSATYQIYDTEFKDNCQKHSKLNNEYYTHFTSPIRRAVDFYIHMLLLNKESTIEKDNLKKILEKINTFTKNSRRFDRNIKRLDLLYKIKETDKSIITSAYIIKISNYKLTLYIPEYNLEEKIIIIPKKFENISMFDILKDEYENIINIKYTIDDKCKIYNLYDTIDIKIWIFTSFDNIFDKIKIEIL